MNVLIVEDEQNLSDEIMAYLTGEGYLCDQAFTGSEASEKIAVNLYDFVLVDLGLPDSEGLKLITDSKAAGSEAAFIVTTARGAVEEKVRGLNIGADDYLAKPFALVELESRMRAVARRKFNIRDQNVKAGDFVLDLQARRLAHNGNEIPLTKKEFELLMYLIVNRNKVLTRHQLYEHIWGNMYDDQYDSNFIDVHIKNIRKKLSDYSPSPWLETVRGTGYRVNLDE